MDFYARLGIKGWPKTVQYGLLGSLAAGYNVLLVGSPGCSKTRFIRNFGALLGLSTRIYDVDKLSFEVLMGELSPDFIGQTSKTLGGLKDEIKAFRTGSKTPEEEADEKNKKEKKEKKPDRPVGAQFINSVCDYKVIGWDEILRGHPATQQSLLLNVMQDKTFQGRDVNAIQVACTNTGFNELFEFNEALLNRFHLVFQCPSLLDMPDDVQDELIDVSGHNKPYETVGKDTEFISVFAQLQEFMKKPPNQDLDRMIKHFIKHLKHPLGVALGDRFSGRAVDHMTKVLYVTMLTHLVLEGIPFREMEIDSLRELMRDTFLSTIYLNDLTEEQLNQVRNSFHLAFLYTFDIEELSLRDRLLSVPNFLVNCEDFVKHIEGVPLEKRDVGGIAVFADRLKKECRNNEPLRYILYRWLVSKLDGKDIKVEADIIDPIRTKLGQMENKMKEFTSTKAEIKLESDLLGAEFLGKIQQAAADRMFFSMDVDTDLYAGLVTTIMCFDPEKARNDKDYVQETYTKYATLRRI